jgi:hypothetical protein
MKSISLLGILLAILGGFALLFQGFSYTHQHQLFRVGSIQATSEETRHVPVPPILGALALLGGTALLVIGAREKA